MQADSLCERSGRDLSNEAQQGSVPGWPHHLCWDTSEVTETGMSTRLYCGDIWATPGPSNGSHPTYRSPSTAVNQNPDSDGCAEFR